MSTYSNRIRELRKNKSLSQEQLADKLGVTKQAISQLERGTRKPVGQYRQNKFYERRINQ